MRQSALRDGDKKAQRFSAGKASIWQPESPGDDTCLCAKRAPNPRFETAKFIAMPHALTSNLVHCIFSTKERVNSIPDPVELGRYLGGVAREKHIPLILAGGTSNHVHLLIALPARSGESGSGPEREYIETAEPEECWLCLARRIRGLQRQPVT